ncbi:MAG: hypothetical protein JWQ38_938 [Flavipsychrobacter sp.]|nr:hypothetical protein [Flavipsychrobacter sp.]
MKRFLLMILAAGYAAPSLFAQVRGDEKVKVYLELDFRPGKLTETYNAYPLTLNYSNPVNVSVGQMKYTASRSFGYNAALGFFFDRRRRFALQSGLIYNKREGTLDVDRFHVEYQSRDYKGSTFRQVITANNGLHEQITSEHISIPLLLRYNIVLSELFTLNLDAGILYNTWMTNNYTTQASFDYEAIYQFEGTGSNLTYNYDNSPVPDPHDWLITKTEFNKDNPKGSIDAYFADLKKIGYNVGLNKPATKKAGEVNYQKKKIGYMGQLDLGFLVTKNLMLKAGIFYQSESFAGKPRTRSMLTNKPGEYNPMLNYVKDVTMINYGFSVGLTYNFYSYTTMKYYGRN